MSRAVAADLEAKAHRRPRPQFVRCELKGEHRWLRFSLGEAEGNAVAEVLDMEDVLAGAPPLQISRLSSSLSHEIRNPLSSVKMAVQTLARNANLSERDQRRLVIANREVRTMERMLWLLAEYGRDTPPMLESMPARSLVQEAAALIEPELAERKIQLRIDTLDEASLPRISVDGARLRPVLAQLLLNVAMGQPADSTVEVKLVRPEGEQGCQLVLVDPSAAVPDEEQASVFEPFGSMLARGAGLSLAALYRVMLSHGGKVTAEAAVPGTVYTLTFPA